MSEGVDGDVLGHDPSSVGISPVMPAEPTAHGVAWLLQLLQWKWRRLARWLYTQVHRWRGAQWPPTPASAPSSDDSTPALADSSARARRLLPAPSTTLAPLSGAGAQPLVLGDGRYTLIQRIGRGGMAEVHLAQLHGTDGFAKQVVVKLLSPALEGQALFEQMLFNEAKLAARLNHPNIVQVIDFGEVDGRPFIVMEYVAGEDLGKIARRSSELRLPMPPGVICRVLADTLSGLHHAHTRIEPTIHRDVSLQNVLVTYAGGVKLVDFGIAKALGLSVKSLTRVGQWKGKFSYMSPEQIRHEPIDARSDVFAAGVLLWELACGRRLFRRTNDFETMHAVCNDPIPPASSINAEVTAEMDRLLDRALARSRHDRYGSAQEMRAELEELVWRRRWRADPLAVQQFMSTLFPDGDQDATQSDMRVAPSPFDSQDRTAQRPSLQVDAAEFAKTNPARRLPPVPLAAGALERSMTPRRWLPTTPRWALFVVAALLTTTLLVATVLLAGRGAQSADVDDVAQAE